MNVKITFEDIDEFMEKLGLDEYEDCDEVVVGMTEDGSAVVIEIKGAKP